MFCVDWVSIVVLLGMCSIVCRWVVWVGKWVGRLVNSGLLLVVGFSVSLIVFDLCLVGL